MGSPQQKNNRLVFFGNGSHDSVGEVFPSTFGMAGGLAVFNGQAGIEQQDALRCPKNKGSIAGGSWRARMEVGIPRNFLEYVAQGRRWAFSRWDRKRKSLRLTFTVIRVLSQNHHFDLRQGSELQGQKRLGRVNDGAACQSGLQKLAQFGTLRAFQKYINNRTPILGNGPLLRRPFSQTGGRWRKEISLWQTSPPALHLGPVRA